MNDDDILREMPSQDQIRPMSHAQHKKLMQPIHSQTHHFPSTTMVESTSYNTISSSSPNNAQGLNLQQQIKDILYQDERKCEKLDLEINDSKDRIIGGRLDASMMATYAGVLDSLNLSMLSPLVPQNTVISHHPTTFTTADGNSELCSLSALQTSPRTATHQQEAFSSVCIPITDRGSLSCENSLSELTATIAAPVNLMESSSDSLIFDSPGSMKDVFSTGLSHDLTKEEKDSVNPSNIMSSNRLLNKLIQSYKPDTTSPLPLRISDFGKIPNATLKPSVPTTSHDYQERSDKCGPTLTTVLNHINSHELQAFNNIRTSLAENNFVHPQSVTVITSGSQSFHHENHLVLSGLSRTLNCIPSPNSSCITETSFSNHFANGDNCINRLSSSSQPLLSDPIMEKASKNVMQNGSNNLVKDNRYIFSDDHLHKLENISSNMIIHSSERRDSHLMTGDQLISASSITSEIDTVNHLNFIPDHQHDQMLSHIVHLHDLPSDSDKDTRRMRPEDLFLSDLHSPDENELGLGTPLTSTIISDIPSNLVASTSPVVSEASLHTTIGNGSHHVPELPPSPILANISSDFLVENSSIPKTSPSQTFLPNLSSTADLALTFSTHFLENSNMSIDMGSFSEGDASLNIPSQSFSDSLDSPKKSSSSTELNFTNAFKKDTEKNNHEQVRNNFTKFGTRGHTTIHENIDLLCSKNSSSDIFKIPSQSPDILVKSKSPHSDDFHLTSSFSNSSSSSESREDKLHGKISPKFTKDDPFHMVQQVSCFKCQICSFLSLDQNVMREHTRQQHSKSKNVYPLSVSPSVPSTSFHKIDKNKLESVNEVKSSPPNRKRESTSQLNITEDNSTKYFKKLRNCYSPSLVTQDLPHQITLKQEKSSPSTIDDDSSNPDDPDFVPRSYKVKSDAKNELPCKEKITTRFEHLREEPSENKKNVKPKPVRAVASQSSAVVKLKKNGPQGVIQRAKEEPTFKCGVNGCGIKMKKEENIIYHRKCHADAFLRCPDCKTKFTHWSSLAMHLWKNHSVDMELHKCEKCPFKSYSHTKLMNGHFRTHSSERPYLCDQCGKDFKTTKQLRSHKVLHTEKKEELKHPCDMCKRKFAEKRMLLSHLEAVHKKMKPYLCNFCGNSFASKSTLNLHIRIHTGEKPFACENCNYRTSDHNSMRRHKMKHSNDRRYACPYCDYTSIQSSTFKVHLRRKHESEAQKDGILFSCPYCTFKTVKKDNILSHIGTHHNISEAERQKYFDSDFRLIDEPTRGGHSDTDGQKGTPKRKQKLKKKPPESLPETSFQRQDQQQSSESTQLNDKQPRMKEANGKTGCLKVDRNLQKEEENASLMSHNVETLRINGTNFIPVQTSLRNGQIQTFYVVGELLPVSQTAVPIVNIEDGELDSSEIHSDIINEVTVLQPGTIVNAIGTPFVLSDGFTYAQTTQAGNTINSVNISDGIVHLTPEVIAMPVSTEMTHILPDASVGGMPEVIYVTQHQGESDFSGRFIQTSSVT